MSELDSLLDSLRGEASLDSGGRFSLSMRSAATRLQKFVAEYPAWPWLRLVQQAHRQQATEIDFQLTKTRLLATFPTQQAQQWLDCARWLLGQSHHPASTGCADVLLGMMSCQATAWTMDLGTARLNWSAKAGLRLQGEGDGLSSRFSGQHRVVLAAAYPSPPWLGLGPSRLAPIHANLASRCCFAPIPVRLDLLRLNDPEWHRLPQLRLPANPYRVHTLGEALHWPNPSRTHQQLLACPSAEHLYVSQFVTPAGSPPCLHARSTLCVCLHFGQTARLHQVGPSHSLPPDRLHLQSTFNTVGEGEDLQSVCSGHHYLTGKCSWYLPDGELLGLSHRLIIPPEELGSSHLYLVRDGIISDGLECDLGYRGVLAITADPRLECDASGLKVVKDDAFQVVTDELRAHMRALVVEVNHCLSGESPLTSSLRASQRLEYLQKLSWTT